jgi:TRAP-type C4-dicarboxylate transport system permease small subunit
VRFPLGGAETPDMAAHAREPRLIALEKSVAGAFFGILIVCLILQVFTRLLPKFLGDWAVISLPWTEELSRFSFVWLLMLGASVGMYNQEHFNVSFVVDAVSPALRPAIQFVVYLAELLFVGFLIVHGYWMSEMVWNQIAPAVGLSYAWVYMSVPVGAALMAVHIVGNMLKRYLPSKRSREAQP